MTLVRTEHKGMEVREILRSEDVRNGLETVRTKVKVFEILQVHEVRMEGCESVRSDCKPLQIGKFCNILTCIEIAEEVVRIRVDHDLLCSCQILDLKRNRLEGLEHEELYILDASLVRTILPDLHIVPMLHPLGSLPLGEHSQRASHCKKGEGVTCRSIHWDRKSGLLNDLEAVMNGHLHIFLWLEDHLCNSFDVTRVNLPFEADHRLARARSPIEIQLRLLEGKPACRSVRKNHVKVDISIYLDIELTLSETGIIIHLHFCLLQGDLVCKSVLNDLEVLLVVRIQRLDTHNALSLSENEGRIDHKGTLLRTVSVSRGYCDPWRLGHSHPASR